MGKYIKIIIPAVCIYPNLGKIKKKWWDCVTVQPPRLPFQI